MASSRQEADRPPPLARTAAIAGAGASDAANGRTANTKPKAKPKSDEPSKNRLREQQQAELAVEAAEAALRAVEDELADPAAWATKYEAAKSEARHTAARRAVEAAYAHLEALVGSALQRDKGSHRI